MISKQIILYSVRCLEMASKKVKASTIVKIIIRTDIELLNKFAIC